MASIPSTVFSSHCFLLTAHSVFPCHFPTHTHIHTHPSNRHYLPQYTQYIHTYTHTLCEKSTRFSGQKWCSGLYKRKKGQKWRLSTQSSQLLKATVSIGTKPEGFWLFRSPQLLRSTLPSKEIDILLLRRLVSAVEKLKCYCRLQAHFN